ncbi:DUF1697 domain-containing protein [Christiangramia sp. LLG6405-1]|uniref:DUF1697 domain-containing protein n=1 Tax=Christiangramia sp. LLG6405-1 TaxID=3160832 RepID=UPI00386E9491
MNKKIAILRGINVGGKRKILMKDLKLLCEKLGFDQIETYIQSGNILLNSDKDNSELEKVLYEAIQDKYGFQVPVIVRNSEELKVQVTRNPFFDQKTDITRLHLTFLKEKPKKENLIKIQTYNHEPDKFQLVDKEVFIYCDGKYHQSKLSNNFFEKKLNVGATTRNWKTVLKLIELSEK